jgi:antiphage defense system Thoeris ThsB-like protein
MALPRTFVGFSSTDILQYRLMLAWKAHDYIDFDFYDCQLQNEIKSEDEDYIKRKCRERIKMASTYVMIIGQDTRSKHKYVRWEAEVAIEKQCRVIGVNLDGWRRINESTCPPIIRGVGAMFVPFSPQIVAHALENAKGEGSGNWEFRDNIYTKLGYVLNGNCAERPKFTPFSKLFPGK